MFGAIAGDVIGSVYEFHNVRRTDFELFPEKATFTDDTVATVAVADAILKGTEYVDELKKYCRQYPDVGYGKIFKQWMLSDSKTPTDSFGNGSAMRVSPVGFAFNTLDEVLDQAKKSAECSHAHIEATIGAQAVASAVFLARKGYDKEYIKKFIENNFKYDLDMKIDDIRPTYKFDATCKGSVPQAIVAFLESENYEDAVRKAVSIGGDSDTIASIAGGIAQAYYKEMPEHIVLKVKGILDDNLRNVVDSFNKRYNITIIKK